MGVPIEMEINNGEPRYNCFLKMPLCLSLISFKCLFFKRIPLGRDDAKASTSTKHCTRADVAVSV